MGAHDPSKLPNHQAVVKMLREMGVVDSGNLGRGPVLKVSVSFLKQEQTRAPPFIESFGKHGLYEQAFPEARVSNLDHGLRAHMRLCLCLSVSMSVSLSLCLCVGGVVECGVRCSDVVVMVVVCGASNPYWRQSGLAFVVLGFAPQDFLTHFFCSACILSLFF